MQSSRHTMKAMLFCPPGLSSSHFVFKGSFLCLTAGMCRVKNALQASQLSFTMMLIVGEVKEKNAACGRNRTSVPRVIEPIPIGSHHSDMVEAVWIWRGVHGRTKLEIKIMHPPSFDYNS